MQHRVAKPEPTGIEAPEFNGHDAHPPGGRWYASFVVQHDATALNSVLQRVPVADPFGGAGIGEMFRPSATPVIPTWHGGGWLLAIDVTRDAVSIPRGLPQKPELVAGK